MGKITRPTTFLVSISIFVRINFLNDEEQGESI